MWIMPTYKKASEVWGKSSYSLVKPRKRENQEKCAQQPNSS